MARKGETWNGSRVYRDPITLREVRQVATRGMYNQTPTYHTNIGFTADGEFLVFGSAREGKGAISCCHVPTGDITQLIEPVDGPGSYGALHKGAGSRLGNGRGVTTRIPCPTPRDAGSRSTLRIAGGAMYMSSRSGADRRRMTDNC